MPPERQPPSPKSSHITHDPMALAKTPKQRAFVTFLLAIEDMTEDDLAAAIEACPAEVQAALVAGPLRYRYDCGVCAAVGGKRFHGGEPDATDPLWRAWGYHEVAKLRMRRSEDLHYGPFANDHYERCLTTYRVAGWMGDAPEPNA